MQLANQNLISKNEVYIIAEAGVNHNGDLDRALEMISVAKSSGANAIKFQTTIPHELVTVTAQKAEYQKKSTQENQTQLEMIREISLSFSDFIDLKKECERSSIEFLSTPFDIESVNFLSKIGVKKFKIPSGEITNLPYLRLIGEKKKPIILSTGMANMAEIKKAVDVISSSGLTKNQITILHCNTEYPTPIEDVNLNAMLTIKEELGVSIGYSDHTMGHEIALAAVAMGASVIEKHFTLDKSLPGPDQSTSLEPTELVSFVGSIRNLEIALGSFTKEPTPSERKNIPIARKSIVAKRVIKKGEKFTEKNITTKRPGTGLSPMKWDEIIGSISGKDYKFDDLIE
uniref:Sialic acid synthase n=1 Tax=uncultured gamma proteobacterium HF0500_05P21 TaxID=723572 RepID=E7C4T0_9GAMM|nr:sialic acid synthase [uncultured gamma proteobacterium HF0500_05P21]